MTWDAPGFVDHHTHLLRVASGAAAACDASDPVSVRAWHQRLAGAGRNPMDEPPEPMAVRTAELPGTLAGALEGARGDGLVQVTEAGLADWRHWDALRSLRDRGPLPVRVRVLVASGALRERALHRTGDPWLELDGVKLYADGWLRPRTCALRDPFADRPGDRGILFADAESLARRAEPWAAAGWAVAVHAIGDRAIEAALDAFVLLWGDRAPDAAAARIEHAQVLAPDLVDRLRSQGVTVCIQPGFAVTDAEEAHTALGPDRVQHAYAWRELVLAGVRVVGGSDFPIESLDPAAGLHRLVTGCREGATAPVAAPGARLSVADAMAVMTDATCGTTVLGEDPHAVAPAELWRLRALDARPAG